ncbi:MAG TPA: AraC family transcriptional regulator [Polyangiaceae bacterium]|nr:AraC family transcriptional regulator [Polyangiaceae bacterium]
MSSLRELVEVLGARATQDGVTEAPYPGVHFYRASAPVRFQKTAIFGPRLIVAAQGRKIAAFPEGDLVYDANHYLVVTGGTQLEGRVVEASPEKPYLALCVSLAPEVVARTLLALADAAAAPTSPIPPPVVPAFVSPLDGPVAGGVVRLLHALEDPLERRVLAPLILNELVFRLLRSEAAAFVRSAVREGDAGIQEAMRYMRENATRSLTVEQVARHVGMSASHFAHRFSAVARITPMRFLKQLRLEAARELMLGQSLRAGDAAVQVGYESPAHFTRDFKQAFGVAPAAYVRRFRAEGSSAHSGFAAR